MKCLFYIPSDFSCAMNFLNNSVHSGKDKMRSRESSPSVNISTINAKKRFRIKQVEKNVL